MSTIDTPTLNTAALVAADLRALADYVERRPIIADMFLSNLNWVNLFPYDNWNAALLEAGKFRKDSTSGYLEAIIDVTDTFKFTMNMPKENTCTKVQVGEREVTREVYPPDVEYVIETTTEPVYEWICPPSWIKKED